MKYVCLVVVLIFSLFMVGCMGPSTEEFSEKVYSFHVDLRCGPEGDNIGVSVEECEERHRCLSEELLKGLSEEDRKVFYEELLLKESNKKDVDLNNLEISEDGMSALHKSYYDCKVQ